MRLLLAPLTFCAASGLPFPPVPRQHLASPHIGSAAPWKCSSIPPSSFTADGPSCPPAQSPHHPRSDKAAALATQRLIDAGVIGPNSHPVASPGMGGSAIADPDASSSSSSATKPSGEGGNGGGLAGKIPGTKAYAATHPRGAVHGDVAGAQEIGKGQEQVERQAPPRPGGFGATSTESTTKSGSVTGSTSGASAGGVSKPTLGDKISGAPLSLLQVRKYPRSRQT